jgi:hypothetical protein
MLGLCLLLLQDYGLDQARMDYRAGRLDAVIQGLSPQAGKEAETTLLLADAHFAKAGKDHLAEAERLYLLTLYELPGNPHPDHAYLRLAQIFHLQGRQEDAELYFKQLIKKFPRSRYLGAALSARIQTALQESRHEEAMELAIALLEGPTTDEEKRTFEAFSPLTDKKRRMGVALLALYERQQESIAAIPPLADSYALWLHQAGFHQVARQLSLRILNAQPRWKGAADLQFKLLERESQLGHHAAAAFLAWSLLQSQAPAELQARVSALLLSLVHTGKLQLGGEPALPAYEKLLETVIVHHPEAQLREHYRYLAALAAGVFRSPESGLAALAALAADQKLGAFSGLYREHSMTLAQELIDQAEKGRGSGADGIGMRQPDRQTEAVYLLARDLFRNSVATPYLRKIAAALKRLEHHNLARQLYQEAWANKLARGGFDLAFEELLTESLEWMDALRLDPLLARHLPQYDRIYGRRGRYLDRFALVQTRFDLRTRPVEEVLADLQSSLLIAGNAIQVERLRHLSLAAEEANLTPWVVRLQKALLAYPSLEKEFPRLHSAILHRQADDLFAHGKLREAQAAYAALSTKDGADGDDRQWAVLQLARLYEMSGEERTALRLYGAIAHQDQASSAFMSSFARRRMEAMGHWKRLKASKEELGLAP